MVTDCWSAVDIIYHSFQNPGETILAEKYSQQIDELYLEIRQQ